MADPNGSERTPRGGRVTLLWVGALALSLGATAVLVLSDDPRLLRAGIVAALWAAFLGVFGLIRLRHRVADDEERSAQRQRVYELELEREIAARREFELEAENEARRRAAAESGNDIEALRAELRTLREVLEPLVGGDFLYERVALQAESTRVRPLSDQSGHTGGAGSVGAVRGASGDLLAQPDPPRTANGAHPVQGTAQQGTGQGQAPPPGPSPVRPDAAPAASRGTRPPAGRTRRGAAQGRGEPAPTASHSPPSRPDAAPLSGAEQSRPDLPEPPSRPAAAEQPSAPTGRGRSAQRGQQDGDTGSAAWTSQVTPGAHAEGTSVVDLLAAYGDSGDGRRRRRRGE